MSRQTLQKIIALENELYAAEEAERERVSLWLQEQEEEIQRVHQEKLSALLSAIENVRQKAIAEARQKAEAKIGEAEHAAACMNSLHEDVLRRGLEKIFNTSIGLKI